MRGLRRRGRFLAVREPDASGRSSSLSRPAVGFLAGGIWTIVLRVTKPEALFGFPADFSRPLLPAAVNSAETVMRVDVCFFACARVRTSRW
ncbi:MAG: hypothetical protein CMJ75_19925 [Planctomycetaceae bacterium]|nr:hypothetical protein [Planctomycetaceae bacterium]